MTQREQQRRQRVRAYIEALKPDWDAAISALAEERSAASERREPEAAGNAVPAAVRRSRSARRLRMAGLKPEADGNE